MACKYQRGRKYQLKDGTVVEILRIERLVHGNMSCLWLLDVATGIEHKRPVRTKYLTLMGAVQID